ncbi:hypothetical protein [Saccharicrinis sp. GN24d3]|uniref:hypothetical protein n=1 Tax=Saccharicrinis sp. GN24d3 TaxID=3458416 RepID=UPI0040375608
MKRVRFMIVMAMVLALFACSKEESTALVPQPTGKLDAELGIEAVPLSMGRAYTKNFNRYTKVTTPNGGVIHIVAQSNITNEQIVRCRSIIEHYLRNYPGSKYGSDKSAVGNKMAANKAILTLLNGSDDGKNPVEVAGQPLYENEIQVEGQAWYVNQNYNNHRDAAFEEILHLVHDYGIGIDGSNGSVGAAPELQAEIRAAQKNALSNKIWGLGAGNANWIKELTKENSLSQEYLASVVDSYYGLWGAWKGNDNKGMWGIYKAKNREEIAKEDPMGHAVMNNKFFHPYLTYNARIDAGFVGTFSLKFDASRPYSHHSRYLKDITLLGNNDTNVRVNELDNDITGNAGVNTIIFSGNKDEYTITNSDEVVTVKDNTVNRDGKNSLRKVEKLQFADFDVTL